MNKIELTEILQIAQNGEAKLKDMSGHATTIAEKWRVKTNTPIDTEDTYYQDFKVESL
jgi:hypothetical protein